MLQRYNKGMLAAASKEALLPSSLPDPAFKGFIVQEIRIRQEEEKAGRNAGACMFEDLRNGKHVEKRIFPPNCEDCWVDLSACNKSKDLKQVHQVYASMAEHGLDRIDSLGEHLVSTLVRCGGGLTYALHVFWKLSRPTVFSWTCLMAGFIDSGQSHEALQLYQQMRSIAAEEPSKYTFVLVLRACASIGDMETGRQVHAEVGERRGFDSNAFLRSALVSMYGSCGSLPDAETVFASSRIEREKDVALWSTMLSAYVEHGEGRKSIRLYRQMREQGIAPDERCRVIVLQACSALLEEEAEVEEVELVEKLACVGEIGRALHAEARRKESLSSNAFLGSALIGMYATLGSIAEAENVFAQLPCQNAVVLCNSMLSAYVELSLPQHALRFFCQMNRNGSSPDGHTYAITLHACCILLEMHEEGIGESPRTLCLEIGLALYEACQAQGLASDDAVICSNLVGLFARCGSIARARDIFHRFSGCDTALWNTMISMYAYENQAGKALDLCKAQKPGLLSETTLVHILQVGGKTGCVSMCLEAHYAIASSAYRGSSSSLCMGNMLVHGYGSCANTADARSALDALVIPDLVSWNALLAGHAHHGDCVSSLRAFEEMQLCGIVPDAYSFLSVLAASAHAGSVDVGIAFFVWMRRRYAIVDAEIKHYVCMIDLLSRTGDLTRAKDVLQSMPMPTPDAALWSSLVRACTAHANIDLEHHAVVDLVAWLQSSGL